MLRAAPLLRELHTDLLMRSSTTRTSKLRALLRGDGLFARVRVHDLMVVFNEEHDVHSEDSEENNNDEPELDAAGVLALIESVSGHASLTHLSLVNVPLREAAALDAVSTQR
jgi:hypothetical protein